MRRLLILVLSLVTMLAATPSEAVDAVSVPAAGAVAEAAGEAAGDSAVGFGIVAQADAVVSDARADAVMPEERADAVMPGAEAGTLPTLAGSGEWYKSSFAKGSVTEIHFVDSAAEDADFDESWDGAGSGGVPVPCFRSGSVVYITAGGAGAVRMPGKATGMFADFRALRVIDGFETVDFSACTDMSRMFSNCLALVVVDFCGADLNRVTTFNNAFASCGALRRVDLRDTGCAALKNFSRMFFGCSAIREVDISMFGGGAVTNVSYAFQGCSGLRRINMDGFDSRKVTSSAGMFDEDGMLEEVAVGESFTLFGCIPDPSPERIAHCDGLWHCADGGGRTCSSASGWVQGAGVYLGYTEKDVPVLHAGRLLGNTGIEISRVRAVHFTDGYDEDFVGIADIDAAGNGDISARVVRCGDDDGAGDGDGVGDGGVAGGGADAGDGAVASGAVADDGAVAGGAVAVVNDLEDGEADGAGEADAGEVAGDAGGGDLELYITGCGAGSIKAAADSSYMFSGFTALTEITGIELIDFSDTVDMSYMFSRCSRLESLSLGGFSSSVCSDVSGMLSFCDALRTVDVSGFDTSGVTASDNMFSGDVLVNEIVCDGAFGLHERLPVPDPEYISGADGHWYMAAEFDDEAGGGWRDVHEKRAYLVTDEWPQGLARYTAVYDDSGSGGGEGGEDGEGGDGREVRLLLTKGIWFVPAEVDRTLIETLRFDPAFVSDGSHLKCWPVDADARGDIMAYLLADGKTMVVGVGDSVRAGMAGGAGGGSADGDGGPGAADGGSSGVADGGSSGVVFCFNPDSSGVCSAFNRLREISGLEYCDGSLIQDASYMFHACNSIGALPVGGLIGAACRDISAMFYGCRRLEELDVSGWDTSGVTRAASAFRECEALEAADLGGLDLSACEDAGFMFCGDVRLASVSVAGGSMSDLRLAPYMFCGCRALREMDLGGWVFAGRDDAAVYLYDDTGAAGVDGGRDSLRPYEGMFDGCVRLERVRIPAGFAALVRLPDPDPEFIPGADGLWYEVDAGSGYGAGGDGVGAGGAGDGGVGAGGDAGDGAGGYLSSVGYHSSMLPDAGGTFVAFPPGAVPELTLRVREDSDGVYLPFGASYRRYRIYPVGVPGEYVTAVFCFNSGGEQSKRMSLLMYPSEYGTAGSLPPFTQRCRFCVGLAATAQKRGGASAFDTNNGFEVCDGPRGLDRWDRCAACAYAGSL